jgi:methylmalonyl-CoA mutase
MIKLNEDRLFNEFESKDKADWVKDSLKIAKAESINALETSTYEGITLAPFYAKEDAIQNALYPSDFPDNWLNREEVKEMGDASELLQKGTTSLSFHLNKTSNIESLTKGLKDIPLHFVVEDDFEDFASLANYQGIASIDLDYFAHNHSEKSLKNLAHLLQNSNHKALCINTQAFGNEGANAVQELAVAISLFVEYLDQLTEQCINPEILFAQSHFSFTIGANYFMEIAKFRAMRLLWKRLSHAYKVSPAVCQIHAQTSTLNKSQKDAYNNMIRATTEAMSAIIAGVNAITVAPYNASFALSDDFSERIARNVSTILGIESHLDKVKDISAGTYYIEFLTKSLLDKSWELFLEIEQKGGFSKASSFIKSQIAQTATQRKEDIESQKKIWVGVNKYQDPKEE